MADIVQQRRGHQPRWCVVALRVVRGLQRVFQLRYRLAEVRFTALGFEDFNDLIANLHKVYAVDR